MSNRSQNICHKLQHRTFCNGSNIFYGIDDNVFAVTEEQLNGLFCLFDYLRVHVVKADFVLFSLLPI